MTAIGQLLRDIDDAPTLMDKSMEQAFCRRPACLDHRQAFDEWPQARGIVARLSDSRVQAVFEADSEEDFRFFRDWAERFSSRCPGTPQAIGPTTPFSL